jgi:hypothetical protein
MMLSNHEIMLLRAYAAGQKREYYSNELAGGHAFMESFQADIYNSSISPHNTIMTSSATKFSDQKHSFP